MNKRPPLYSAARPAVPDEFKNYPDLARRYTAMSKLCCQQATTEAQSIQKELARRRALTVPKFLPKR